MDTACHYIAVEHQISLGAGETDLSKLCSEEHLQNLAGVSSKHNILIMGFLILIIFVLIAHPKNNHNYFLMLLLNIKMLMLNTQYKHLVIVQNFVHAACDWPSDHADDLGLLAFEVKHVAWLYKPCPTQVANKATF